MISQPPAPTADNGVNVEALLAARAALTEAPEGARFKWRATSQWLNGTHTRSTVDGFFGLGAEQRHRRSFEFDSDPSDATTRSGSTFLAKVPSVSPSPPAFGRRSRLAARSPGTEMPRYARRSSKRPKRQLRRRC